jgi:hypothetical protein
MADFNNFIKGFETPKKPEQNVAQQPTQPKPVDPKPVEPNLDEIISKHFGAGFKKSSYDPHTWEGENGEEYWVGNDEEATQATRDDIQNYIDEAGIEGFTPYFQDWIHENAISEEGKQRLREEYADYFNEIGQPDDAKWISETDDDDLMAFIYNSFPDSYEEEFKRANAYDIDKILDEAISLDGRGHFLSGYDGKEIELPHGLFAYRRN